jgi:hypothetical protein
MHEISKLLYSSGWISERDVTHLDIVERKRLPFNDALLHSPVEQINDRSPDFYLYWDVLRTYQSEFNYHLKGIEHDRLERLPSTYAAVIALGGMAIKRQINHPTIARTAKRLAQIGEVYSNTAQFREHFIELFGSKPLGGLLGNMLDRHSMQLNGLRASMTVVRAAMQMELGCDFLTDDIVTLSLEALNEYVAVDGTHYMGAAEQFRQSEQKGVTVFSYAIPEWLLVLSFPMDTSKVAVLLED